MQIGVLADTHVPDLLPAVPQRALQLLESANVVKILHAGDLCRPTVLRQLEEIAPVVAVRGNRDLLWPGNWSLPSTRIVEIGGVRIGLTHGHSDLWTCMKGCFSRIRHHRPIDLWNSGRFIGILKNVTVIVYGHTHIPSIDWIEGRLLINPGSLAPAKGTGSHPTIVLARIEDSILRPQIVRL